jgi:hypothetical protein
LQQLFFLLNLDLSLFLIGFDLLLELLSLGVDLDRQSRLNVLLFPVLLAQLRRHHLHLFGALLFEVIVLHLQVVGLLLDKLVLFLRLRDVFGHLGANGVEVLVEVFEDLLALSLLVILDLSMALLKLLVLRVVLSRYLLVLLPDDVCL